MIDEEDGLTPLIVSSGRGFTTVVEKLLEYEAQVGVSMSLPLHLRHRLTRATNSEVLP